ncbi:hypothetical protein BJX64DRAFT_295538 [Aspergillus heterothallicus]
MSDAARPVAVTGIPSPDNTIKGSQLPLVFLTDLENCHKNRLVEHLQSAIKNDEPLTLHLWHPSPQTLAAIAKQGPHLDSQGNIHAVATLAARAGWTGLLVADELTKRQLTNSLRVGEYPTISVVMVSIRPRSGENEVSILAKRTAGATWPKGATEEKEIVYEDYLTEMDTFKLGPAARVFNPFADGGLALHDLDRPPFVRSSIGIMGWEEGLVKEALPIDLSATVETRGEGRLDIFLMFDPTPDEQRATETTLQKAFETSLRKAGLSDRINISAIPWSHHQARTRRQMIELWHAYDRCGPMEDMVRDIFLLDAPIHDRDNITALGVISSTVYGGLYLTHIPLRQILPLGPNHCAGGGPNGWSQPSHETTDAELVFPPELPFYTTTPDWQPTSIALNWVSVFYLTDSLTPEEDGAIRAELVKFEPGFDAASSGPKTACFVPWKPKPTTADKNSDGTVADMWNIFWSLLTYKRGRAVPYGTSLPTFFIDRQSAEDKTVLAASWDFLYLAKENHAAMEVLRGVECPKLRGMKYNRVPASQAHSLFRNVGIANMGFEEFGDPSGVEVFPRPGWPGHGVLDDD